MVRKSVLLNRRVRVYFNPTEERARVGGAKGVVIRDSMIPPYDTTVRLDDGTEIRGEECYSFNVIGDSKPKP